MSRAPAAALAACLAVQVGLSVHAMRGNSATFDEGAHVPAGWTHLVLRDHRLNPEQPPLVKLLAAAPVALARPAFHEDDRAWREARQWELGRRFLYRWNDGRRILFLARLPIVALASLLVVAVFAEARRRFGAAAGCVAAALCAFSPEVLAHGTLVTTDLGFALFFFVAVAAFARLLEQVRLRWLLAAGLATGAAFATKFSGPALAVVLGAMAVAAALSRRAMSWQVGTERPVNGTAQRLLCSAALLLATLSLALAVIWASYGFRGEIASDPAVRAAGRAALAEQGASGGWRAALVTAADAGLLPEDYVRGLLFVMRHSGGRSTFLLGRLSEDGFPHYFLVTFLLKTPLPLLLLVLVAALRARGMAARDALFVWLPVLLYVALTFARSLQIGHRHLLPIAPFLFVAAGEAAAWLLRWRRPLGALSAGVLGLWYAGGTLVTHPHHLASFNELAGGPANGWRLLVDSNLDWGQDLERLGAWMRAHRVPRVKLSYFGSADPAYYGIEAEMLPGYTAPHAPRVTREIQPGDVVAVSVTNLQGVYVDAADRPLMARLRELAPIGRAGWSIRIYRADFRWPQAPDVLAGAAR